VRIVEDAVLRVERAIELVRDEVLELKGRVSAMESRLEELRRRAEDEGTKKGLKVRSRSTREERLETVAVSSGADQLPSFLRDNPWVEILSRKGRS
jgi:predicted RNase H-like nuclease (RuvC/YqgF family)